MDNIPAQTEPEASGQKAKKGPPLWKQILGSLAGAVVALGVYSAYEYGGGRLMGYIIPPGWEQEPEEPKSAREISDDASMQQLAYDAQKSMSASAASASVQAAAMADIAKKAAEMASITAGSAASAAAAVYSDASSAVMIAQASSTSTSSVRSVRSGSRWSAPAEKAVQADKLPDSGFPVIGVIGAALGAAVVRRRKHA
jgi:hypothetical protein